MSYKNSLKQSIGSFIKKVLNIIVKLILFMLAVAVIILFATYGKTSQIEITPLENTVTNFSDHQIIVMTINMAHGRSNGRNQIFQSNDAIRNNVNEIGRLIAKREAHIVALQEADGPSWWSGGVSHINAVGMRAGMTTAMQANNVDGLGLHYGTAIISKLAVKYARQETFPMSFPSFSKGFLVATCVWPPDISFEFDVISLHLDFLNATVRAKQLSILKDYIKHSTRPVILMGDFNTDMNKEILPKFLEQTGLVMWKPNDKSIITFPKFGQRIDFILVSSEFKIIQENVLPDVISDHRSVEAIIERNIL